MVNLDLYSCVGYSLELLAKSEYHKDFDMGAYLEEEVLPAIELGQARFYLTAEGIPTGFVTWAWLSETVRNEVHKTGRGLEQHEWQCGPHLFANDFVTPYGTIKHVVKDLATNLFPNEIATSLRRHPDGLYDG